MKLAIEAIEKLKAKKDAKEAKLQGAIKAMHEELTESLEKIQELSTQKDTDAETIRGLEEEKAILSERINAMVV